MQSDNDNINSQQIQIPIINIKASEIPPEEISEVLAQQNKPKESFLRTTGKYCKDLGIIIGHIVISPSKVYYIISIYIFRVIKNYVFLSNQLKYG